MKLPGIAVFASGEGSNFEALCQQAQLLERALPHRIELLLTNRTNAGVVQRAKKWKVPVSVVSHNQYPSRAKHEEAVIQSLQAHFESGQNPLFAVVLAGYMRVLSPVFFTLFRSHWPQSHLLNLHPALLNDYKGPEAYSYAVQRRFPRWGITVHRVTEELDGGPRLKSSEHPVFPWEQAGALHKRFQSFEHSLLTTAIRDLLEGKTS